MCRTSWRPPDGLALTKAFMRHQGRQAAARKIVDLVEQIAADDKQ